MSAQRTAPASSRDERFAIGGLIALLLTTSAWWALALWPADDSAQWILRTRAVCFGVQAGGLPDAGGWIGLIGGPLGMLGILVAGWGRGMRTVALRSRRNARLAALLAGLGLGSAVLVGSATWRVHDVRAQAFAALEDPPADPYDAADYPRLDRTAPALKLSAHDGSVRSLASLRGRPVLVTFAFAHCATVCPLIVHDVLAAQAALQNLDVRAAVLIVTLDPWRDTPSRLPSMALDWGLAGHDAWVLGGDVDTVQAVLDAWQIPRTRDERTGDVTHPGIVYIVDASGQIAFAATAGASTLVDLVSRLAPDAPLQ